MSDNGVMFWPATTTTAIIDPTSRETLPEILNEKVSVGNAGNISSTVLPPIILESIATVSTNLTINATLIGKTYFCPDLEKIRHFYALEVNQSFQTTPEDTDPSPEITYYDKETDKFYRWDATAQEMVNIVAETSSEESTFLNINLADLESDTVSTFLTEYYPSLEEDHLPSSTFEDSEGKYKNVTIRIRVLEEDNPEGISSENIDENYWNFSLKLTPLALETTDNTWNKFNNFLFGSYTYYGTTYSAFISKFINNTGYTYYIQKIKLENLGTITSLPAYGDVPVYPTAGDNINIAFGKINRIVQSHEEITSKALIDLNNKINTNTGIEGITYKELVNLRYLGKLIPGKFYRITNYTCTTTQTNTQSAGHVFDIIVLALSESTLSETAWADHHEGDTYFTDCKLEAWELRYCLDNDTTRFDWADTTNGKGVIYWMKDEWNNECPYDFKNIQFKRKLSDGVLDTTNGDDIFVYTFNLWRVNTSNIEDASIIGNTLENDEGHISGVYGNKINPVSEYNVYSEQTSFEVTQYLLNDNVFLNSDDEDGFFYGCYTNILGYDCFSNTFGSNAYGNTFGDGCKNNTFGNSCDNNTFGDSCFSNTFGNGCDNNTFGNVCFSNTFGNNYFSNTFGNDCYDNILGTGCNSNIFGNSCQHNVFGDSCAYNISGNVCTGITLGTGCNSNIFGNYCTNITALKNNNNSYNIFENNIANISLLGNNPVTTINNCTIEQNCRSIIFGASSFKNGTVESGNSYINLIKGISGNGSIQNFRICSGIAGTSSLYKNIIFNIVDNSYLITYKPANSVEISI